MKYDESLKTIKLKHVREQAILKFLDFDKDVKSHIKEKVNFYSWKFRLKRWETPCMIYVSTFKVCFPGQETKEFSTLRELKTLLLDFGGVI